MRTIHLAIFTILATALTVLAVPPEADKLKTIYEQQMKRLTSQAQAELLRTPQEHIAAMRELEASYQKSGELKPLLAVRKERQRFARNPGVSRMEYVTSPAKLRSLQETYVSKIKDIRVQSGSDRQELKEKYLRAMENLQKELTQQGKIESALAVMHEVEALKNSTDAVAAAPSGTGDTTTPAVRPTRRSDVLDVEALGKLLHGEVTRWSSYSRQITITYDFSDPEQLKDWKGGTVDEARGVLICKRTVAWVRPQFLQVMEMEYDALLEDDTYLAGMVIGDSLQAEINGGSVLQAKLFQTSSEHPISSFIETEAGSQRVHRSKISFERGRVEWSINGARYRRASFQTPIRYPTYLGFGHMGATSGYDNITLTGILSKEYAAYLKQQLAKL
jgi:hypothetical protein